jgi:hypothetical protein
MSEAVAIDIPSLIRLESQKNQPPHCLTKRYQLPEHYYPSYLRHPNQPFSSHSSVSSSSSSSSLEEEERDGEESIFNESSSAISVDGEFDVRIDMIAPSPEKEVKMPTSASSNLIAAGAAGVYASAPPLSDDDIENIEQQEQEQEQQEQQEEEACVCVICYENFEEPAELIRDRNYTSEELEDIEGKEKITDFCQTCKYNVHHRCIDEYRLTKMTDMIRNSYQRGYIQPPDVAGTFRMNCLMCAKEVEKIHVSVSGEVDIVKTQPPGSNAQNQEHRQHQQQQQQPQHQQQLEEIMRNRMQRRLRRRQRFQFCKNKFCSICFMFLVAVTLLVLVFRMI